MNYSEKLVNAYMKNYKPGEGNVYIKFKTRNDIAVWSNDPVYINNMIIAKKDGNPIYLGKYEKEIRQNAEQLNLKVYETDPKNHKFTACIPAGILVDVAMDIRENNPNVDYISESAVIKYYDLMFYTDTMDNDQLKNYFMHKEEGYGE